MLAHLFLLAVNSSGGGAPSTTPSPSGGLDQLGMFLPLILIFILGYFLMIRPMPKQ